MRAIHTCALPHVQLKQLKELEQEKEVLLQGLEMMARGRDWYQQQLQRVQERQRRLGRSRASTVSNAARDRAVPVPRQGDPPPCTCRNHPPNPRHPQVGPGCPIPGHIGRPSSQGAGTPTPDTHTP